MKQTNNLTPPTRIYRHTDVYSHFSTGVRIGGSWGRATAKPPPRKADRLLFGGSFDPPHRGHLEILRYVLSQNLASYIDLVPAAISPFKESQPPLGSAEDRLWMLSKSIDFLSQLGLPV